MAVSTTNAFDGPFIANGVATTFPFTFTALTDADVTVEINGVAVSGYSVTIAGGGGGSVIFDSAPTSGEIYILLDPSFQQLTQFEDGSAWLASAVNRVNDRSALREQRNKRDTDRALKVPLGETPLPMSTLADSDGKALGIVNGVIQPIPFNGADNAQSAADAIAAKQAAETAQGLSEAARDQSIMAKGQAEDAAETAAAQIPLVTAAGGAQVALAAVQAGNALTSAQQAQAAALGLPLYPILNASTGAGGSNVLPKGITTGTVGGTAVSGATPGTYPLTASGGDFTGVIASLVVASATSAAIVVVDPGRTLVASPTAPTWAKPSGATLPAGTTLTANIGDKIAANNGQTYLTPNTTGTALLYWQNTGTGVPVAVLDPTGKQQRFYSAGGIDALLSPFPILRPRSGWLQAKVNSATGRIYEGVRSLSRGRWQSRIARANLDPTFASTLPVVLRPRSGWLFVEINSKTGRATRGQRKDGTFFNRGGITTVTESNLATSLKQHIFKERTTVRPVRPDGMQSKEARFGVSTHPTGWAWTRLPYVEGAQYIRNGQPFTNSAALQFRRRLKVNEAGKRKVGTWSPGAIASTNKLGDFSNNTAHGITALPSATTKAQGDYFYVFLQGGGSLAVSGVGTVYNGDIIVNNNAGSGLAWTVQAGPGDGYADGSLYERDWWEVSGAGTFDAVTYAVGDRIVRYGGSNYQYFLRGRPDLGEMFNNGELSGSAGIAPSSPKQGDIWQITSAGTISGVAVGVDDWLLYDGAAFYSLATGTITTTLASRPFLVEITGDTSDYEVRRADKSTSINPVRLFVPSQAAPRVETNALVWFGDSMSDFARNAILAAFVDRTVEVRGHNSEGSDGIASVFEYFVRIGQYLGRTTVGWLGQNTENDWQITLSAFLRMYRLCSAFDRYFVPVTPAGRRTMSFNGTRLVGLWHEPMKTGTDLTNGLVALLDAMNKPTWPFAERYVDARAVVVAAVAANAATFSGPDLQFPGMTEAQTAATYGFIPLSVYYDLAGAGLNPATASFKGYWGTSGTLPTGGANQDYYLRSVGDGSAFNSVGNILANIGGTWTELSTGSSNSAVHFGGPNGNFASAAVAAAVRAILDLYNW